MQKLIAILIAVWVLAAGSAQAQRRALAYVDPVDIAQLKAECLTNPNNYSYTDPSAGTKTLTEWFLAGDDTIVANILNRTRAGITIYRTDVTPQEVTEAIAVANFVPAASQNIYSAAWFHNFGSLSAVRLLTKAGANTRNMTNLLAILTNASASETRLIALGSRTGSRAEQLWSCVAPNTGVGCEYITITTDHVLRARQLP